MNRLTRVLKDGEILRESLHQISCCIVLLANTLNIFAQTGLDRSHDEGKSAARVAQAGTVIGWPKTIEELRTRIQEIIRQPQLSSSFLAIKVGSLETGKVLFEENATKLMHPASNLKLYTVAAALDRLTPEYRFVTSIYAEAQPDASGILHGDLVIYGRGDPTFSARFNGGDYNRAIDDLAGLVEAAGVKRVDGDLVGDESHFIGERLAPGWAWDDLQWYYGVEVSALSVDDNALDVLVTPGVRVGDPCRINSNPATSLVTVVNRITTGPSNSRVEFSLYRSIGENVIEVVGSLPLGHAGIKDSISIFHVGTVFTSMLRASLEKRGVTVKGRTLSIDAHSRKSKPLRMASLVEIARRQSPPLSVIAAQTLKPSQNLYAELILRALSESAPVDSKGTTAQRGLEAVTGFLKTAGIASEGLSLLDGSGVSRGNLVTAEGTLRLLSFMAGHRYTKVYHGALPIAGVDGTLVERMKGTLATRNAHAKTGALGTIASLSGYVTSAAGERLVFSVMINNCPRNIDPRSSFIDPVTVLLASFSGRS